MKHISEMDYGELNYLMNGADSVIDNIRDMLMEEDDPEERAILRSQLEDAVCTYNECLARLDEHMDTELKRRTEIRSIAEDLLRVRQPVDGEPDKDYIIQTVANIPIEDLADVRKQLGRIYSTSSYYYLVDAYEDEYEMDSALYGKLLDEAFKLDVCLGDNFEVASGAITDRITDAQREELYCGLPRGM